MLSVLDVIIIHDVETRPPKTKMVVCICPEEGLFYRINSYDDYPIGVAISKDPYHNFLKWDSFIECGKYPIELDDFSVQSSLQRSGGKPIGRIHQQHAEEIGRAVLSQPTISKDLKKVILNALRGA